MAPPARKPHYCSFCGRKCNGKTALERHIRYHTQEKLFPCDKCKREFSCKNSLTAHVQSVHLSPTAVPQEKYKCALCSYETQNKYSLECHIRVHTGERIFPCKYPNCEYAAKSCAALKRHNVRRHTTDRNFLCRFPNCGYKGKTKYNVSEHFETHKMNTPRPFGCDFPGCNYRAKKKGTLKGHKLNVHHGGYKPFACSMCNYSATTKTLLSDHERRHSEEKPFKCDFNGCKFACKSKGGLTQHALHCHTDKVFKCDVVGCSSTAASQLVLELHKRNVHYEKVYKCPSCNFRAAYSCQLRQHLKQHNGRQRTSCPHEGCTFRSINQTSMKRHLASHKANLGCLEQGCGYVGRSSSSLKRHMQIHDPTGRPFPCPLCPKRFSKSAYRRQHLRTHTEEKPVKCPACQYASKIKHNMMRHVRAFHSTTFPDFGLDRKSTCDHCHVNFGCAIGLAMHRLQLKSPVVILTRLHLKLNP